MAFVKNSDTLIHAHLVPAPIVSDGAHPAATRLGRNLDGPLLTPVVGSASIRRMHAREVSLTSRIAEAILDSVAGGER
jgi:hypothetical protein